MSSDLDHFLCQAAQEEYYTALLSGFEGLEVRQDAGGGRGKGLFATQAFKKDDVIFQERPLVGIQELHSKMDTSTCANCFTAVGTVEQALGGKICCLINELSDATEEDDLRDIQDKVDKIQAAVDSKRLEGLLSGKLTLPLTDRVELCTSPVACRGGCDDEYCSKACEERAWQHHHCLLCPGPQQQPQQHSSCSSGKHGGASSSSSSSSSKGKAKASAAAAEVVHGARVNRAKLARFLDHADDTNDIFRVAAQVIANTIITADQILQQAAADASESSEASAAFSQALSAAAAGQRVVLAAAGPAAATATSAQLAAAVPDAGDEQQVAAAAFEAASSAAAAGADGSTSSSTQKVLAPATAADAASSGVQKQPPSSSPPQPSKEQCLAALKAAFLPYAVGHKAPWWQVAQAAEEAAAAAKAAHSNNKGDDGGDGSSSSDSSSEEDVDPEELAAQLRELAGESLALLRAGLQDERFPELFDLQLYGSLVGMFELNNLALTVPAPVGRYKAMLSDPTQQGHNNTTTAASSSSTTPTTTAGPPTISPGEAAAALAEVTPLLEALGDTADDPAEGTGFFALQSTVNHSCAPNAVAECVPSGQVVITALEDVAAGSEVLLSYIEEAGVDWAERQAALRDYGFVCACQRCQAEHLADGLKKSAL